MRQKSCRKILNNESCDEVLDINRRFLAMTTNRIGYWLDSTIEKGENCYAEHLS